MRLEDINGDMKDLVGSPILMAEEVTNYTDENEETDDQEVLWTFYKLATIKGTVVLRWMGTSNGYYAIGVSLYNISEDGNKKI